MQYSVDTSSIFPGDVPVWCGELARFSVQGLLWALNRFRADEQQYLLGLKFPTGLSSQKNQQDHNYGSN